MSIVDPTLAPVLEEAWAHSPNVDDEVQRPLDATYVPPEDVRARQAVRNALEPASRQNVIPRIETETVPLPEEVRENLGSRGFGCLIALVCFIAF